MGKKLAWTLGAYLVIGLMAFVGYSLSAEPPSQPAQPQTQPQPQQVCLDAKAASAIVCKDLAIAELQKRVMELEYKNVIERAESLRAQAVQLERAEAKAEAKDAKVKVK